MIIGGDTAGIEWRVPVYRFKGSDKAAPSVYIQAALHANELPGTALLHFLLERLRKADTEGAIRGDITVIPQANPIGLAQFHFGEMEGRFDLASRTNFNRDYPLIALAERETLLDNLARRSAADRLKRTLLHTALGHDLVLDLHCDDESLQYAYIDDAFWPEAADLAAALDMQAVFLSDGESTAFEEAVGHAFKHQGGDKLKSVEAPELPSEREFVASIDTFSGKREAPPLALTDEQRQALPIPPKPAPEPAEPGGPTRTYPPLEPRS